MKNEAKIGAITVAGQPTDEELRALAQRGFATVINNRVPDELPEPEAPKVPAGVTYAEIPFTGATLSRGEIEQTRAELAKAKGAVLMH
jgi:uncharacterized protein (TIGR01244 family)